MDDNQSVIIARDIEVDFLIQKYGVDTIKKYLLSLGRQSILTRKKVLKGINLEVVRGERLGLIGRNGAGKTTLVRVIAGIINPSFGYLEVRGSVAPLLGLGVGLEREMSGKENIILSGTLMGLTSQETREIMPSVIDFSELGSAINMEVKRYSSGMMSRLGFSISNAILSLKKADILVIDEALSVGDIGFQQKCEERIGEISNSGATIIYVSHGIEGMRKICDRVAYLEDGRIIEIGLAEEVINKYKQKIGIIESS